MLHRAIFPSERRKFDACRRLYSNFVKPGGLAFDVGANIGTRSEVMLSLGAKVVSFEPQPDCATEIRARGDTRRLTVVEAALGKTEGAATFHLCEVSAMSSLLPEWADKSIGSITVPVTTLDVAIEKYGKPDFCKIDVEGFETDVIGGLSRPLKSLSLEYQTDDRGVQSLRVCITRLLDMANYEVNFTSHEDTSLVGRWTPGKNFLRDFPSCVNPAAYGDIFLRKL